MNEQPSLPVTPNSSNAALLSAIPIIARSWKAWRGLTIEWERLGPYAFKPHQFPEHRVSMALNRCPNLVLTKGGVSHDLPLETGDLSIVPAGMEIGYSWESQIEILSLQLEPTFLEEVAALTMDLDGHQVELVGQPKLRDPFISTIAQTLRRELECESTGSRLLVDFADSSARGPSFASLCEFPGTNARSKRGVDAVATSESFGIHRGARERRNYARSIG
jgi:hypothetical protein